MVSNSTNKYIRREEIRQTVISPWYKELQTFFFIIFFQRIPCCACKGKQLACPSSIDLILVVTRRTKLITHLCLVIRAQIVNSSVQNIHSTAKHAQTFQFDHRYIYI